MRSIRMNHENCIDTRNVSKHLSSTYAGIQTAHIHRTIRHTVTHALPESLLTLPTLPSLESLLACLITILFCISPDVPTSSLRWNDALPFFPRCTGDVHLNIDQFSRTTTQSTSDCHISSQKTPCTTERPPTSHQERSPSKVCLLP